MAIVTRNCQSAKWTTSRSRQGRAGVTLAVRLPGCYRPRAISNQQTVSSPEPQFRTNGAWRQEARCERPSEHQTTLHQKAGSIRLSNVSSEPSSDFPSQSSSCVPFSATSTGPHPFGSWVGGAGISLVIGTGTLTLRHIHRRSRARLRCVRNLTLKGHRTTQKRRETQASHRGCSWRSRAGDTLIPPQGNLS